MSHPHLNKAPIVEGLIDIRVKQRSEFSLKELEQLKDELKTTYPVVKDLHSIEAGIQFAQGKSTGQSFQSTQTGYRLERKDPSFVVLLQQTGLTVSRLKPYEDWNNLIAEAKPIWEKYRSIARPSAITRVATRFINRLEFPIEKLDFDNYLLSLPPVPKNLPNELSGFLVRTLIPDPDTGAEIAIAQALESPNMQTRTVTVLIDIDAFKTIEMEPDSGDVWKLLDKLRDLKNRAFFGSITPKTVELFK